MYSDGELAEIMERVEMEADRVEENAAFGGESHDGGAAVLRDGVNMFRLGMNRRLPAAWLPFAEQIKQEQDPEWENYLRLKKKFGDKQ